MNLILSSELRGYLRENVFAVYASAIGEIRAICTTNETAAHMATFWPDGRVEEIPLVEAKIWLAELKVEGAPKSWREKAQIIIQAGYLFSWDECCYVHKDRKSVISDEFLASDIEQIMAVAHEQAKGYQYDGWTFYFTQPPPVSVSARLIRRITA